MDKPPFAIGGLDHIVLRVVDLAAMLRFSRDLLGCPLEKEQPELGLWQLRAGSSLIDLVTVDGPLGRAGGPPAGRDARNLDHVCISVEPFDEAAIRAHLRGVPVSEVGSRYGAGGEGPSVYATDPEGNVVELKGAPAPAGRP